MKRTLLISLFSVAFGFATGWFFKSATHDFALIEQNISTVTKQNPQAVPEEIAGDLTPPPRPRNSGNPKPGSELASRFNEVEQPRSINELDNARWLRLSEVLGLNSDQVKTLEALIEETRPIIDAGQSMDTAYADAAVKLEEKVLGALTPEQQEEFKKLQARDRENRIESTALKSYETQLGNLDLTADQRNKVMDALREDAELQVSSIPDSTRLLLADSFLPIGDERLTEDGFRLLGQLNASAGTQTPDINTLATIQRKRIASEMNRFESILTPGQLARYRIALQESLSILEKISPQR